jgi:hypothetical protein
MEKSINEKEQCVQTDVMQSVLISEKDFRIGNLFFGNYETEEDEKIHSVVCKLLGYDPFNSFYWVENKDGIEEFCSFQKIPLTDEWLRKLGFKQDVGEPERFFNDFISLGKYGIHRVIEYNGYDFTITYVHELQNLYFSLTQLELTVA